MPETSGNSFPYQTPETTEADLIQQIYQAAHHLEQLMGQARQFQLECTVESYQERYLDRYRPKQTTITIQIAKLLRDPR